MTETKIVKAQMEVVGWNTLRKKMKELGITKAEVVVWPPHERDPVEVGVIEIQEVGV